MEEIKIPEKIILVDNLTSINEIENFTNQPNSKFITFDYTSHIKLTEKKIEHEISEIYSDYDVIKLQKNCYNFLNWYDLDIIKKNFSFLGINIPKLYNNQLIHVLVSITKKFSELKSVINKFPNSNYFASGVLLSIVSLFEKPVSEIPNGRNVEFYFDKVEIGTNIGKKNIKFSISNSSYKKIKKTGEKLLGFTSQNKNNKSSNKSTLLVELNTKFFDNFFLESKKVNKNISYYGRRRPGVWDLESFKIMKNSGCRIITSDLIDDSELKKYQKDINEIKENFLQISNNDSELKNFFSIDNISILSIIIPTLNRLIIDRLEEIIFEIILAKQIFEKFTIDSIVIISEIGMTEQIIIQFAKQKKLPIILLQEGLHIDTPEAFENSKSQGVFLKSSDLYVAWGKFSRENQIAIGKVSPEKIVELGSPRFNKLNFIEKENDDEFVLLATMPPQIEQIKGIDVRNLEKYLDSILNICEIVSNQKKKLVIKLHPTFDVLDIEKNVRKKFPDIQVISKGDIDPLIRKCSSLIVTGYSTVIIQGQILQKPVISIPLIDYNWGNPSIYTENSCLLIKLEELDMTLKNISTDKLYKNKLISNANNFLKTCINNKNNSSQLIWNYIKKISINNYIQENF
jgi:hypothetical protein